MNDWWNDPSIPAQQLAVVRRELAGLAAWAGSQGGPASQPYQQFFACVDAIPKPFGFKLNLIDIGAGVGHYGEALRIAGYSPKWIGYRAMDCSEAFQAAALAEFPWMKYDVGLASSLPYPAASFDVALSSACLMYAENPQRDIWEATRVSSGYVIFHRTPIEKETRKLEAPCYGGTVLETRFSEVDLFTMFDNAGLSLMHTETIFEMPDGYAHKTYLLKKDAVAPFPA